MVIVKEPLMSAFTIQSSVFCSSISSLSIDNVSVTFSVSAAETFITGKEKDVIAQIQAIARLIIFRFFIFSPYFVFIEKRKYLYLLPLYLYFIA